ncbi:MAG: heme synthase [Schumannella sp.]|nr:heme synthase [Schumannella sp.]
MPGNRKAARGALPTLAPVISPAAPRPVSARVPFRGVLVLAWATLVTQILIVGTGGAVRLTASGLGCPTWPLCTDASLVPTPEMGIHGGIEFGNRLLSIVVGLVAVALVVFVLVRLRSRRDLLGPALAILALTVLQGLVGGLSVRVKLDPSVVGLHFVTSAVLVALATVVVYRATRGRRGERAVPRWFAMLVHVTSAVVAATVVVGVLTTGSGPHAGDDASSRNGLDPELLQHIHSWPAYLTFALTLALVIAAYARRLAPRSFVAAMLGVELVQIAVGLTQANTGLPPLLVGTHMVLAVVLVSVTTATVLALRGVREGGA